MMIEVNYLATNDSDVPDGVNGIILSKDYESFSDFDKPECEDSLILQHGKSEGDTSIWEVREVRRIILKNRDVYMIYCFMNK
ncbi:MULTISPECIES: hypothetical protein [Proteus]|uniref:Uncharacterized protein n=1 Tax=Proteus vulgaris TaxID=585 RepID=A0A6G6SHF4_PROVU|nr:hypothetical protein [Proteus vulgaris]QIF93982.1 hypothetical protein GTH24_08780 [Proteus vulgaris]